MSEAEAASAGHAETAPLASPAIVISTIPNSAIPNSGIPNPSGLRPDRRG